MSFFTKNKLNIRKTKIYSSNEEKINNNWEFHISTATWELLLGNFSPNQKSVTLPFLSQSPYLVGSGPFGPPTSPVAGLTPSGNSGSGSFSWAGWIFGWLSSFPII